MKTIKISEATELQLDWLVAKCEGEKYGPPVIRPWVNIPGATVYLNEGMRQQGIPFRPTRDWKQCGPIIEREGIRICKANPNYDVWGSVYSWGDLGQREYFGRTPLIAALRCYVASKLGEAAEIPEGLE